MAHARLGPSNHRWVHCPGSIREEAVYPDISGDAAIDGTGSHLLLEMCLENNVRSDSYLGQVIGANHEDKPSGWLVSLDRIERVQMALDYISHRTQEFKQLYPNCSVNVLSETRSNPGSLIGRDDWWGTVDITFFVTDSTGVARFIEIADYKDGRGYVSEKDNSQLYSYLIGKLNPFIETVDGIITNIIGDLGYRMTIIQPKTNPVIRYYEPTTAEVVNKARDLTIATWATDDEDAPLVSGKHCQWCKHKKNCTAKSIKAVEGIKTMTTEVTTQGGSLFEVIEQTFGDITQLESSKLTELADAEAGIQAIFDKVKEEIQSRIETGQTVPGYAMKPGRSKQVWAVDESEVEKALKNVRLKKTEIYPSKLLSPAQMQKHPNLTEVQRKRLTENLVTSMEGKLSLQKVSHQEKSSVDMFKEVSVSFL